MSETLLDIFIVHKESSATFINVSLTCVSFMLLQLGLNYGGKISRSAYAEKISLLYTYSGFQPTVNYFLALMDLISCEFSDVKGSLICGKMFSYTHHIHRASPLCVSSDVQ